MAAPGWYPDPANPAREVYWDGSGWIADRNAPGVAPPPAGPPPSAKSNVVKALVALAVLAGGLWVADKAFSGMRDDGLDAPALPTWHDVEYCWRGGSPGVDVTMANAGGDTEQGSNKANNQCVSYRMRSGDFMYVSVQNQGSGSLTCEIKVDGLVRKTSTSSGEYVIASCSGSV